jgi:hypothetical protein
MAIGGAAFHISLAWLEPAEDVRVQGGENLPCNVMPVRSAAVSAAESTRRDSGL